MSNSPFILSIEPAGAPAFRHGFHLGTVESVARACAEDRFHGRNAYGLPTATVALIRDGAVFDTFDGRWSSATLDAFLDEAD